MIRLLGPVSVVHGGEEHLTRSVLLRTLLALLAVVPGRVVDSDVLVDELWSEDLPADPRAQLAVVTTRLRRWLRPEDIAAAPVAAERGGYRLTVPPTAVDLVCFDAAAERALVPWSAPPEDPTHARRERLAVAAQADAALAWWRDAPFGGCVLADRLGGERVRLVERRLQLVERRSEALLAAGEAQRALDGLLPVRASALTRERLTALVMIAQARLGRRREALAAYEELAGYLRDEVDLVPGQAIQRLHRRLRDEPTDSGGTARWSPVLLDRCGDRVRPRRRSSDGSRCWRPCAPGSTAAAGWS